MVAKLVVEDGDLKGLSLSLEEGDTWTIGRDPEECQLVIEDPLVSRKHLIARKTPEGIVIENLSETNPVLLNEEEIGATPYPLQNGDTLKIGNEVLRYYEASSAQVHDEDIDVAEENVDAAEEDIDLVGFDDIDNAPDHDTHPDGIPPQLENPSPPIQPEKDNQEIPQEESESHDTIFEEENGNPALAEIDFGVIETGRWLLKVIGGPNSGAEFYMQTGNSYVIGTDPQTCDIVFHDTSVSRQHARISVTPEDTLFIEDLKSRNGVLINGALIGEEKQELALSTIITLGTTSFVVYDREGEMQTIISPLLPSIVKVLQQEPAKVEQATPATAEQSESTFDQKSEDNPAPNPEPILEPQADQKPPRPMGHYIVLSAIIGLFVLAGIGTTTLFHEEPIVVQTQENANELLKQALASFPSVRWTFNKSNGSLLLLGHVASMAEKNRLVYNLGDMKFIKSLDDSGIIIDEGVLNEVNSLLLNNSDWRSIRVYSPAAGQFVLSGTLKSRKQAEQLSSYLSLNFPYLDLLKKQIVVEEDVASQIQVWLQNAQFPDISVAMMSGEVTLTGSFPAEKANDLNDILSKIKQIPGVRIVSNQTRPQTADTGIIDISSRYPVTGKSRIGNRFTVVINGRILSEGDDLDGMSITKITTNHVYLQKDRDKFRIDY